MSNMIDRKSLWDARWQSPCRAALPKVNSIPLQKLELVKANKIAELTCCKMLLNKFQINPAILDS